MSILTNVTITHVARMPSVTTYLAAIRANVHQDSREMLILKDVTKLKN